MDWAASARLSAARGSDEFIVRERFADEAPRVVVLADRRPSMSIESSPLRTLDKPQAILTALELIGASAIAARSLTGYLDYAEGEPYWRRRAPRRAPSPGRSSGRFDAPADTVSRGLDFLGEHRRDLPTQAFVFVLSDFIVPPDLRVWQRALEHRWELVPVMIQDPVWERSFPDVGGITVSVRRPAQRPRRSPCTSPSARPARLRDEHEARWDGLVHDFRSLGIEPVAVHTHDSATCSTRSCAGPTCARCGAEPSREARRCSPRLRRSLLDRSRTPAAASAARTSRRARPSARACRSRRTRRSRRPCISSATSHGEDRDRRRHEVGRPGAAARDDRLRAVRADEGADGPAPSRRPLRAGDVDVDAPLHRARRACRGCRRATSSTSSTSIRRGSSTCSSNGKPAYGINASCPPVEVLSQVSPGVAASCAKTNRLNWRFDFTPVAAPDVPDLAGLLFWLAIGARRRFVLAALWFA